MSNIKRFLLHGLLFASFAVVPVAGFAMTQNSDMNHNTRETPKVEKTQGFRFGVYYGRPYYYRPYYYRPYAPYSYRYHYYPYRYNYYRW